jgi:hypothetical protein
MKPFDYITIEDFRHSLESDYTELCSSIEFNNIKAAHVLAGSIVEAVIIDSIISEGILQKEKALKLDLHDAIEKAQTAGIISKKTYDLSSVIRDYRNLIHPGRIIRLNEKISANSAYVAKALVDIVIDEISTKRRQTYGYTAEQILSKISKDSSVDAILLHLLKGMNNTEIRRLLLVTLPRSYLSAIEDEYAPPHLVESLSLCFRNAFSLASEEVKKEVAERFICILKEESERAIETYGTAFFRFGDMKYVSTDDADLAKKHFLSRLKNENSVNLVIALSGIGQFLAKEEAFDFVDSLIKLVNLDKSSDIKKYARECLQDEGFNASETVKSAMILRLNDWIPFYRQKNLEEKATVAEEIKDYLEIPF